MNLFDVYPINDVTIVKAKGSYVWDNNGEQYLDLYGGHAVISIGHTHPHWVKRIEEQLEKIAFYSNSIKIQVRIVSQPRCVFQETTGNNPFQP